jgi:hypothetical protein
MMQNNQSLRLTSIFSALRLGITCKCEPLINMELGKGMMEVGILYCLT